MIPLIVIEFDSSVLSKGLDAATFDIALTRAVNRTTDRLRTKISKTVREQVNFPASYLSPGAKRLWVSQRANKTNFTARIEGRGQATSLARFARNRTVLPPGKRHKDGAVSVMVAPGVTKKIKRAFLIRLNNDNIGLAVRTKGEAPKGAYKPKLIAKNLWLLYGPSVDQALIAASDGDGVFDDLSDDALLELETELNRQMDLLNV